MLNHYSNNQMINISKTNIAPYGSYAKTSVAKSATVNSYEINPYAANDLNIKPIELNESDLSNFIDLQNYISNKNSYVTIEKALNLPSSLTISNINLASYNGIGELTISNSSNITYKIIENINNKYYAYFILPKQNNQQILLSNASLIKINNNNQVINNTVSYNLTNLYENNNQGAVSYRENAINKLAFD